MAHMGSYVPAKRAKIPLTDHVYSRVGASDNLVRGESTFLVEMSEAADILNHLTARTFIIMDEIGRGTSTYDGLSIAWSILEFLSEQGRRGLTLFATHYHELAELSRLEGVINFRMAVAEWEGEIIFTHNVEPGAADRSYGIEVARLAGIPQEIISRAGEILTRLTNRAEGTGIALTSNHKAIKRDSQMELFHPIPPPSLLDEVMRLNPHNPDQISQLQRKLSKGEFN